MTDRERLEAMARENEDRRAKEAAEVQRKEEERKQAQAELAAQEKQKTDELRAYCEATFKGYKLIPTGQEVSVGTTTTSRMQRIENDGGEYVTLLISHWSEETGNFQGSFPILMARYKGGVAVHVPFVSVSAWGNPASAGRPVVWHRQAIFACERWGFTQPRLTSGQGVGAAE